MLLLGYCYSARRIALKRHRFAPLVIAALGAALAYLTVLLAAGSEIELADLGSIAFLSAWVWAGGASKDFSDVAGDAAEGRRTLPIAVGDVRARTIIAARVATIALMMTVASLTGLTSPALLIAPAFAIVLVAAAVRPTMTNGRSDRRRLYRLFMMTQFGFNIAYALG